MNGPPATQPPPWSGGSERRAAGGQWDFKRPPAFLCSPSAPFLPGNIVLSGALCGSVQRSLGGTEEIHATCNERHNNDNSAALCFDRRLTSAKHCEAKCKVMDFESLFIFHLNVFDDHHLLAYDKYSPWSWLDCGLTGPQCSGDYVKWHFNGFFLNVIILLCICYKVAQVKSILNDSIMLFVSGSLIWWQMKMIYCHAHGRQRETQRWDTVQGAVESTKNNLL